MKNTLSHLVFFIIGLLLALTMVKTRTNTKKEVEVIHDVREVPVEILKEVVKTKVITKHKVVKEVVYLKADDKFIFTMIHSHLSKNSKNRISVMAGVGPDSLKTVKTASDYSISINNGLLGGISYSRKLNDEHSLGIELLSNGSVLGMMGVDF